MNYALTIVELLRAGTDQSSVSALADPNGARNASQNRFEHCDGLGRPYPFVLPKHFPQIRRRHVSGALRYHCLAADVFATFAGFRRVLPAIAPHDQITETCRADFTVSTSAAGSVTGKLHCGPMQT